jgi:Flp pilus assembly protein TadG
MALEVTLITPVLVVFMLMVVAFGRLVWVKGQVEAATRDAARAASIARSFDEATGEAEGVVDAQLNGRATCDAPTFPDTDFAAGGVVTVRLQCHVSYSQLGLLGLGETGTDVVAESSAPLDRFRRTGGGAP